MLEELESFKIEMEKDVEEEKLSRINVVAGEGVVRITDEQSKCPQPLLPTPQLYQLTYAFLVQLSLFVWKNQNLLLKVKKL